jgi:hypothetical protein
MQHTTRSDTAFSAFLKGPATEARRLGPAVVGKSGVFASYNRLSSRPHHRLILVQIVQRQEPIDEQLLRNEQMPEVRP